MKQALCTATFMVASVLGQEIIQTDSSVNFV